MLVTFALPAFLYSLCLIIPYTLYSNLPVFKFPNVVVYFPLGATLKGALLRYDCEFLRNGVSNLFMIFAPLEGFRHVEVTDTRTSIDFAHICRDLVDVHFSDAEKITLVCDNLNTHKPASLYKLFYQKTKQGVLPKKFSSTIHQNMEVG